MLKTILVSAGVAAGVFLVMRGAEVAVTSRGKDPWFFVRPTVAAAGGGQ